LSAAIFAAFIFSFPFAATFHFTSHFFFARKGTKSPFALEPSQILGNAIVYFLEKNKNYLLATALSSLAFALRFAIFPADIVLVDDGPEPALLVDAGEFFVFSLLSLPAPPNTESDAFDLLPSILESLAEGLASFELLSSVGVIIFFIKRIKVLRSTMWYLLQFVCLKFDKRIVLPVKIRRNSFAIILQ
jgi:hypothetical protein